jgi:hypothetical protein
MSIRNLLAVSPTGAPLVAYTDDEISKHLANRYIGNSTETLRRMSASGSCSRRSKEPRDEHQDPARLHADR